ncbi:MAG: hypothetical protein VX944_07065 [Myxococcota bacterium]|nr:hypothetical protein [Myxococcota bacterium]MEC9389819.1 hypothetical protein [Myxococcota bacterium]
MQGLLEFQGRLTRSDKRPANPGSYCLQFQLHGQPRDSKRDKVHWEEVLEAVDVAPGGFFRVVLGRTTPFAESMFGRGIRWMSVRVVRSGTLDEEHSNRTPIIGAEARLYGGLDRIKASVAELADRMDTLLESSPQVRKVETRVDQIGDTLTGLHSRLAMIESGTETAAIVRRVESLMERLDAVDRDNGRLDRIEDELYEIIGPDGDVVDLNERMDRLEGRAPELIAALRKREKSAPQQLRLEDLKRHLEATRLQLASLVERVETLGDAVPKKASKSAASADAAGMVKRSGDAMTGGLVINRGGLDVLSGGLTCRGATVTTLEASKVVKSPKMIAESFELRGDLTVDSANRALQVRTIEGRQASARRDGALHLNGRGGAEVIMGNEASARGATVHGTIRSDGLVAHTTGGMAQLFHATGDLSPGDVVRVNDSGERVVRVRRTSDERVMGVITDQPGVLLGGEPRTGVVVVAVTGVVSTRVDATERAVKAGDLLVASSTAGHACAVDQPTPGTVLGKALAPLASGTGEIAVLLGGG